jgi:hypothetical protein
MLLKLLGLQMLGGSYRAVEIPGTVPVYARWLLYIFVVPPAVLLYLGIRAHAAILKAFGRKSGLRHLAMTIRESLLGSPRASITAVGDTRSISPSRLPSRQPDMLPVRVVDNFYPDPEEVRASALKAEYTQHAPLWWVTAWESGKDPAFRSTGNKWSRRNGPEIRRLLEAAIGAQIRTDTWELAGDGWNGAFHLRFGAPIYLPGGIHHHWGMVSAESQTRETEFGWTGVVYLSPSAPNGSGTSIWRDQETGLCYASPDETFVKWRRPADCEKVFEAENVWNRLVLMDSRLLHRAETGFGREPEAARLLQTFFFDVEPIE